MDEEIARLERGKRWAEAVRALEQRGARTDVDRPERIAAWFRAMQILSDRFAHHTRAIEAAEQVLALDPDHAQAISYLRDAYQKRREHGKLAALDVRSR